jgi:hypothetical protein
MMAAATAASAKPQIKVRRTARLKDARAPRTDGSSRQLLRRRGEAVEKIAGDEEEIHQHGVCRQGQRAELHALPREKGKGGEQRERTDHDVAIDGQHPEEVCRVEDSGARRAGQDAEPLQHDGEAKKHGDEFAGDGGPGDACDLPA